MPLNVIRPADLSPYLKGEKLLGDDATPKQLKAWYAAEAEGYADLVAEDGRATEEGEISAALNRRHFANHLKGKKNLIGLAIGAAEGTALQQLTPHIKNWFSLEPAKSWQKQKYYQKPVKFLPVNDLGTIKLADNSVDVIVALSVMHHIANVSFVLSEFKRVLKPGGLIFLREPTVTMGDWTTKRPGLTPNERGLPLPWLHKTCGKLGLKIIQDRPAVFPPFDRLVRKFGVYRPYANRLYVAGDAVLSWLMAPLARYHRPRWYHKFAPAAVLMVAQKPKK